MQLIPTDSFLEKTGAESEASASDLTGWGGQPCHSLGCIVACFRTTWAHNLRNEWEEEQRKNQVFFYFWKQCGKTTETWENSSHRCQKQDSTFFTPKSLWQLCSLGWKLLFANNSGLEELLNSSSHMTIAVWGHVVWLLSGHHHSVLLGEGQCLERPRSAAGKWLVWGRSGMIEFRTNDTILKLWL